MDELKVWLSLEASCRFWFSLVVGQIHFSSLIQVSPVQVDSGQKQGANV